MKFRKVERDSTGGMYGRYEWKGKKNNHKVTILHRWNAVLIEENLNVKTGYVVQIENKEGNVVYDSRNEKKYAYKTLELAQDIAKIVIANIAQKSKPRMNVPVKLEALKELNNMWLEFLEENKFYFLLSDSNNEAIDKMKTYEIMGIEKHFRNSGSIEDRNHWVVNIVFKKGNECFTMDTSEHSVRWDFINYSTIESKGNNNFYHEFESLFNRKECNQFLNNFLFDVLNVSLKLNLNVDEAA